MARAGTGSAPPTSSVVAQAPDICGDRRQLLVGQLCPAHRRHGSAILLRLRHSLPDDLRDAPIAAVAPEPRCPRGAARAACPIHPCHGSRCRPRRPRARETHRRPSATGARRPAGPAAGRPQRAGIRHARPRAARRAALGEPAGVSAGGHGVSAAAAADPAAVGDAIDPPARVVGNVECAVRSDRNARRAMRASARILDRPGKAVGEDLARSGGLARRQRLKHDVVAALRKGCAVPGAVESDEGAAAVVRGETVAGVERQIIRRPVSGE